MAASVPDFFEVGNDYRTYVNEPKQQAGQDLADKYRNLLENLEANATTPQQKQLVVQIRQVCKLFPDQFNSMGGYKARRQRAGKVTRRSKRLSIKSKRYKKLK